MRITGRLPRHAVRALWLLAWALAGALPGAAAAQVLTVEGSTGPVTVSPLLRAGLWLSLEGPAVRREIRLATVAWTVPAASVPPHPVVPGITLHVTERPETGPCSRYLDPRDLPPSVNLPAARLTGSTALDLGGARFRPGRTYYVRGCVFGIPLSLGGGANDGPATNTVAVHIDWAGVSILERVNLNVDSGASRLEPIPDATRVVSEVRATLQVRSYGRAADRVRASLPDRFVVDVYVNAGREPVHRAVVTGVARRLAEGAPDGLPVTVVHPIPPTAETHLVQYVINADGTMPEQSYEDNQASMSLGYHVHPGGVTFARNWHTEGPFNVWISPRTQGADHAWVVVGYGGGPLEEGVPCTSPSCTDRATTNRVVDPTPSLHVWVDSPDVGCVGPGGFFEPTLARSLAGGAAATPPPRKDFFCYAGSFARVPFETATVTVEGRVHGVSRRASWPLRNAWSAVVADPYTRLPDLTGEVVRVDFLGGRPISSVRVRGCGERPKPRFRVRNDGVIATPHVVARVWISPPTDASLASLCASQHERFDVIPPLDPGQSHEFERDFGSGTLVAPGATVNIDVDSGLEVVEVSKINNRQGIGVPTCSDPDGPGRCR